VSEDAGGGQGPEKGSIGLLAQVFPRGVVDSAIGRAGVVRYWQSAGGVDAWILRVEDEVLGQAAPPE